MIQHRQMSLKIPTQIYKRDKSLVEFNYLRIYNALEKCFNGLGIVPQTSIQELTEKVINLIAVKFNGPTPTVEDVQNLVEVVLQSCGEYDAAKSYILYRDKKTESRNSRPIPDTVKEAFEASKQYFPTPSQQFQFYNKYSRYDYDLGRRETWVETVDRAVDFMKELSDNKLPEKDYQDIRAGILNMNVMPSMRLLAMAGPAARRNNIALYNCSYSPVDSIDSFVEALIISMSGCGVGFSVESQYVDDLPKIKRQRKGKHRGIHVIADSSEGWADALRFGLETWFDGADCGFDFSLVREAGAPLKIKGGRASGPDPLRKMLSFIREKILSRQGSCLRSIDAHDIMCEIGNAAVSGGMRRTAMISLFDMDDREMLASKSGDFERHNSRRWNANNSAVWTKEMGQEEITQLVLDMVKSGRGEPGIFSRLSATDTKPSRREARDFGTNPCGEIILRPNQFCNLSIAVARENDTKETLIEKVRLATIIGTIQSMATHFPGLRPQWKENCEEERLLGVDITGQLDSLAAQDPAIQKELKELAVQVNKRYSEKLDINQSASITCVKPSGNSSQLLNCAAGIHARPAKYQIRNMRISAHVPMYKVLKDAGVPMDPENGQMPETADTWVVHFPKKAPDTSITKSEYSALDQCKYWLQVKNNFTEHNPSVTINYKPNEIIDLIKWVWKNQAKIGGMAFLPTFDAKYDQMPDTPITEAEYNDLQSKFPEIDYSKLYRYEEKDYTTAAQELACMAGSCDI